MQSTYCPFGQYKQQQQNAIKLSDPVTIIRMLLEGAISYNKKAMVCLEHGDKISGLENIQHAVKIVMHLYVTLDYDKGGKIAEQLGRLYQFISDQYIALQKDTTKVELFDSINNVLTSILDGWKKMQESNPDLGGRK